MQYFPLFILSEGSQVVGGREVTQKNIEVAGQVSDLVRTCLGPRGLDKLLLASSGELSITSDGHRVVDQIEIAHPAAKTIADVAKIQEKECGDGVASVVILTGELLSRASRLLNDEVSTNSIIGGYHEALNRSRDVLKNISSRIARDDRNGLIRVARSSITGKVSGEEREILAEIIVDAVLTLADGQDPEEVRTDHVTMEKFFGGSLKETELIRGVVLDNKVLASGMPQRVEEAKIALFVQPLEFRKGEWKAEIEIEDPTELRKFLDRQNEILKEMADKIAASGATVVLCQKELDETVIAELAGHGILAAEKVDEKDLRRVARATGADLLNTTNDLEGATLGTAKLVEEIRKGTRDEEANYVIKIDGCPNPRAVTILVRGISDTSIAEAVRAIFNGLKATSEVYRNGEVVVGGGAAEAEISSKLTEYAASISGREQLAVQAFVQALEIIPITLAENAGASKVDALIELKRQHTEGNTGVGVSSDGEVRDLSEEGIYTPLRFAEHSIQAAVDATTMLLRIDEVISAKANAF